MEPLFINLPVIAAEKLEEKGGFFGWVLRLIQQRKSRPREFQRLLNRVVQHLESMPEAERRRWLELLSYIMALVYHVREPSEWPSLQQAIEASVQTDEHRQEVFEMRRTIADELKEEGAKEGALKKSQQTLIRLLKRRFGDVPDELSSTIRATSDPEQLDNGWTKWSPRRRWRKLASRSPPSASSGRVRWIGRGGPGSFRHPLSEPVPLSVQFLSQPEPLDVFSLFGLRATQNGLLEGFQETPRARRRNVAGGMPSHRDTHPLRIRETGQIGYGFDGDLRFSPKAFGPGYPATDDLFQDRMPALLTKTSLQCAA